MQSYSDRVLSCRRLLAYGNAFQGAQDSEEGRALRRKRAIVLTAASSVAARAISFLMMIVSVPLTIGYLGHEQFGVWQAITSLTAFVSFADLGLGNGITTLVAGTSGRDDFRSARRYIAAGSSMLIVISSLLFLGVITVGRYLPWGRMLSVSTSADLGSIRDAGTIVLGFAAIAIPFGLASRIQYGLQQGYYTNIASVVGAALGFIGLLMAVKAKAGLVWLVIATMSGPFLANVANTGMFFVKMPDFRPTWTEVRKNEMLSLLKTGSLYFVLQVAGVLAYQKDALLIANCTNPAEVARYSVSFKLFMIAPMIWGFMMAPLWPAYGEAIARGDRKWVAETLNSAMKRGVVLVGLASLFLIIWGKQIVRVWAGNEVVPSTGMLVGLALWATATGMGGALAMFLNGAHIVKFQVICATLVAILSLSLSFSGGRIFGSTGVVFGTVIAQVVASIIPSFIVARRWIRNSN